MENEINKKTLKQSFKDAPPTAGIYCIKNTVTNMNLILSAQNAKGVLNRHLFELKFGQHRNTKMQQDWNTYGEKSFEFLVIKSVKPDEQNIKYALEEMLEECKQHYGLSEENTY